MFGSTWRNALVLAGLAAAVAVMALPQPAAARGFVHFGFGFPVGPAYYPPPPVYYGPPPVYYAPPPVYYSEPPAYYAPPAYAPPTSYAPPPYAPEAAQAPNGPQCREYTTTSIVGGQPQQVVGTACLQADGTWRIVR
jgi:hypothetical protein